MVFHRSTRIYKSLYQNRRTIYKLVKTNIPNIHVASPPLTLVSSAKLAFWLERKVLPTFVLTFIEKYRLINMESNITDLKPPLGVKGMKCLDKTKFQSTVKIPSVVVPTKSIKQLGKFWKKSMLKIRGVKSIANLSQEENEYKLFLLDPNKYKDVNGLSEKEKDKLLELDIDISSWKELDLDLTYENWTYSDTLGAILPEKSEGIGGFSQMGHIIHLNLKEELLDYKKIIGK